MLAIKTGNFVDYILSFCKPQKFVLWHHIEIPSYLTKVEIILSTTICCKPYSHFLRPYYKWNISRDYFWLWSPKAKNHCQMHDDYNYKTISTSITISNHIFPVKKESVSSNFSYLWLVNDKWLQTFYTW